MCHTRSQRSRALVRSADPRTAGPTLVALWKEASGIVGERQGVPAIVLLFERHLVDLSGVETLAQAEALAASELEGLAEDVAVALVAVPLG